MKAVLTPLIPTLLIFLTSTLADFTYVTGNMQLHDDVLFGSSATSTLEAGHTFDNDYGALTVLTELDAIQICEIKTSDEGASLSISPYITLGIEQILI